MERGEDRTLGCLTATVDDSAVVSEGGKGDLTHVPREGTRQWLPPDVQTALLPFPPSDFPPYPPDHHPPSNLTGSLAIEQQNYDF